MVYSKDHFTIPDMANMLKVRKELNQQTVLVLGSRTGGLFRSEKLYETLKLFGDPSFTSLPRSQQFGECHHLLTRRNRPGFSETDIDTILTEALRDIDITDADICLAELVKLGLFDIIITTSMDNTLEDALEFVGMQEMRSFEVFSLHTDIKREKLHFGRKVTSRLIKVFGTLKTREYLVKRSGYINQNTAIRTFLEDFLAKDIIVIGLDPIWDEEIYQVFKAKGGSFWLIGEETLSEDSTLFHIGEGRGLRHFSGEEVGYQYFTRKLHEQFFDTETITADASVLRELRKLRYEVRALREEIQKSQKLF
jgi:hypothetical protein